MDYKILKPIKILGFDWDGTCTDAFPKAESFAESIIDYFGRNHPVLKGRRESIKNFYLLTGGTSRFWQCGEACQREGNFTPKDSDLTKWSQLFTDNYIKKNQQLFWDTESTLSELKNRGYKLFLGSRIPQEDFERTIKKYSQMSKYFEFMYGSSEKIRMGPLLIGYAAKYFNLEKHNIAFVGDGVEDVKGVLEAGALPIGKFDSRLPEMKDKLKEAGAVIVIQKLSELLNFMNGPTGI